MGDVEPSGRLHPLTCPSCRAPVPLGDGDRSPCPYCAAEVELPAEYRTLRDATRARADARARADELFDAIGRPPSALARLLIRSLGFLLLVAGILVPVPVILVTLFIDFGGTPFGLQLYDVLSDKQRAALTRAVLPSMPRLAPALLLAAVACRAEGEDPKCARARDLYIAHQVAAVDHAIAATPSPERRNILANQAREEVNQAERQFLAACQEMNSGKLLACLRTEESMSSAECEPVAAELKRRMVGP